MADATYLKAQVRRDCGDIGRNAVHEIVFPVDAAGGVWNYTFAGSTVANIDWPNTASAVQTLLEGHPAIGAGNIGVKLGAHGFKLEYQGALAAQDVPIATVDGTNLTPEGAATASVTVNEIKGLSNHWTDVRITEMWERRSNYSNIELQFLYVKLDAIEELKGQVWTQINEETGDQKREYEKQFAHLLDLEGTTNDKIADLLTGSAGESASNRGTSRVSQPAIRAATQAKFDNMRCGVYPR